MGKQKNSDNNLFITLIERLKPNMQLSLLDEVADKKRIGFLATTWDGQRLALLLTKDPPDGSVSENP